LAVHTDGCVLEAAEAVCAQDMPATDVLDLLGCLVDRSLVVVDQTGDTRYRLLESVAAYCVDRMREAGELDQVRQRHRRYYADLAQRAEPHLYGSEQRRWLLRLDAETSNLHSALDGIVRQGCADTALRMTAALTWYWYLRGRLAGARRSLEAALALPGPVPAAVLARAVAWHAGVSLLLSDAPDWAARREATLRTVEDIDDPVLRAKAQWILGFAEIDLGDLPATEDLVNRALATFRAAGDRWGIAATLSARSKIAHIQVISPCSNETPPRPRSFSARSATGGAATGHRVARRPGRADRRLRTRRPAAAGRPTDGRRTAAVAGGRPAAVGPGLDRPADR
jgi:hypothetical protein